MEKNWRDLGRLFVHRFGRKLSRTIYNGIKTSELYSLQDKIRVYTIEHVTLLTVNNPTNYNKLQWYYQLPNYTVHRTKYERVHTLEHVTLLTVKNPTPKTRIIYRVI